MLSTTFIILLVIRFFFIAAGVDSDELEGNYAMEEREFFKRIWNGYSADVIPPGSTTVRLSMSIHHLSIADSPHPTVKYGAFIQMKWTDPRIGWNPADEGGKQNALVPTNYKLWIPPVASLTKGYTPGNIHRYRPIRAHLRVNEKSKYQTATITVSFLYDGKMDCAVAGAFPFEQFTCFARFASSLPVHRVNLNVQRREILMKKFDFEDDSSPSINGWKVEQPIQYMRYYNPFSGSSEVKDLPNGKNPDMNRFVVESRLVLRRAGWTLSIVVLSPLAVTATLISATWIVPARWSIYLLLMIIYILCVIVRDSIEKVNVYSDKLEGVDLSVISLWTACTLSFLFHLLLAHFAEFSRAISPQICVLLNHLPYFEQTHNHVLAKDTKDDVTFEINYVRSLIGISTYVVLIVILFL